jgi:hypothetical protein
VDALRFPALVAREPFDYQAGAKTTFRTMMSTNCWSKPQQPVQKKVSVMDWGTLINEKLHEGHFRGVWISNCDKVKYR